MARYPLRERLRAQLMLALYRAGRQADALAAYREARRALVDELGIEPGRQLQELEQSILRQDASLDLPVSAGTRPGRRAAGVFVGRERELAELAPALEDATAGRGRLFLVSGESGVGKTRLADELASRAKNAGARVLWGRCSKRAGAPPYWPWTQALQPLDDVPELDPALDDEERFGLFVDLAAQLRQASSGQPVLLVFDDLQHGDDLSSAVAGVRRRRARRRCTSPSSLPTPRAPACRTRSRHSPITRPTTALRLQPLGVDGRRAVPRADGCGGRGRGRATRRDRRQSAARLAES